MNPCYWLADSIHRVRRWRGRTSDQARRMQHAAYWDWQFTSSAEYFSKIPGLHARLANARVIDIGCGLGGRTCYLATQGVAAIVGTDINQVEINLAQRLSDNPCCSEVRHKIEFQSVEESEPARHFGQFDIAMLIDTLEHVRNPQHMLDQAYELLKPGGLCFFSTWGWYHHRASHVYSMVPVPFATVLFSDKQILDAVRRVVDQDYYQPTIWDSKPPSARWQNCKSLHDRPGEYLNKYRICDFRRAMANSKFGPSTLSVVGFSPQRHAWLSKLNFLARLPIVQEIYHSAIFGCLQKPLADELYSLPESHRKAS